MASNAPETSNTPKTVFFSPEAQSFKHEKKHAAIPRHLLATQRKQLPIFHAREKLLQEIEAHQTVIVVGETGSGKTTQLAQYLYESKFSSKGMIGCTQPRRVAAVTVARRVAEEVGTELGTIVGYSVRFDEKFSDKTKLKYLTDGMLLREAMSDPTLSRYSVILLDEAHERTLHTDVLFAFIKSIQKTREDLKVVVMSATLEAEQFSSYFNDAPVLYVQGRQYPVYYASEAQKDYVDSALVTVLQIHQEQPEGDILVFLTGQDEIESLEKLLNDANSTAPPNLPQLRVCPMFGALAPHQQMLAFDPAPPGTRKVILATNIAETSITINGIKYVVDTGLVIFGVRPLLTRDRNGEKQVLLMTNILVNCCLMMAEAKQRAGRAGRESSGFCYRLYKEDTYMTLSESTQPEILRCNLTSVVLQLMSLNIKDVLNFDYMDPPPSASLLAAIDLLHKLGAIDDKADLTAIGHKMVNFPLDPKLSRVIVSSKEFGCGEEVLSIVAMLSVENLYFTPRNMKEKAEKARMKFASPDGDLGTLLNVYKQYKAAKGDKGWCFANFVNMRSMETVDDTRKQLLDLCNKMKFPLQSCGSDSMAFRKCFISGLFNNVAVLQPSGVYKSVATGQQVFIHPSSSLFGRKPQCVLFNDLVHTTKTYMRDLAVLDQDWLLQVAPNVFKKRA